MRSVFPFSCVFVLGSVVRLVVAVGTLRGRHRLAFAHIDGVDDVALSIHDLVGARLRAGIAAIQSHNSPPKIFPS